MKCEKRGCHICDKLIEITEESIGRLRRKIIFCSEEGVFFHVWFCNECWNEIIRYYENNAENSIL